MLSAPRGLRLRLLAVVLPAAAGSAAAQAPEPPVEAVAALRADRDGDGLPDRVGERVRVRGVITSPRRSAGRAADLINFQDATGGLVLFSADTTTLAGLAPGDTVDALGRLDHDAGMEEVRVERLVRRGRGAPPSPVDVAAADLRSERLAGRLIRVRGRLRLSDAGGLRLAVEDETGAIPIHIRREFLEDRELSEGLFDARRAAVIGIASQDSDGPVYDDGYDVVPRTPDDLTLTPPPPWGLMAGAVIVLLLLWLAAHARVRRRRVELQAARLAALTGDLRKRDVILETVGSAARRFLGQEPFEMLMADTLGRLVEVTGAEHAFVFEAVESGDGLRIFIRHYVGPVELPEPARASLESLPLEAPGLREWIERLRTGEVVRELSGRDAPAPLRRYRLRSLLLVPVFTGDRWWGALSFHGSRGRPWSGAEVDALRAAAGIIGAALGRRAAEDALGRSEEQLRHAQKMEAVGRLAGGIAHDFNNMLTAIGGHARILSDELDPDDPHLEDVVEIRNVADRAAALTRQLLAFSRQQVLRPRVLDLRETIAQLQPMLRRLIPAAIRLECLSPDRPCRVRIDPSQMEQTILNLVVNARDAMPDGGLLRLALEADVPAAQAARGNEAPSTGPFVRLTVQDTGTGMAAATMGHIFEPFFTTKEAGKGTGLGLSTVYGTVKQSGGFIWAESELGRGTAFHIYLPGAEEAAAAPADEAAGADGPAGGMGERILLVEDEPAVRKLALRVLERAGFYVIPAASPLEALGLAAELDRVDLLVTDMVMPEMDGRALAARIRGRWADLPVVFMSGYTVDDVFRSGDLGPAEHFLEKPFAPADLAVLARRALDQPITLSAMGSPATSRTSGSE